MRAHLSSLGSPVPSLPSTDEESADEDLANMRARTLAGVRRDVPDPLDLPGQVFEAGIRQRKKGRKKILHL